MIKLHYGDCLHKMDSVEDKSVQMVLTDLPYAMTKNKWDSLIPLDLLWKQFLRIGTDNAAFVFTSSQPFTSFLIQSNINHWRHEWIWIKNRGSNFMNSKREPFKEHESIQVFSRGGWVYNQKLQERIWNGRECKAPFVNSGGGKSDSYGKYNKTSVVRGKLRCASSHQKFDVDTSGIHPTVKPVALFQYLIEVYTNKGDTVLDCCMGSGTAGVAAVNSGRNFIGIEKHEPYFKIAEERIKQSQKAYAEG